MIDTKRPLSLFLATLLAVNANAGILDGILPQSATSGTNIGAILSGTSIGDLKKVQDIATKSLSGILSGYAKVIIQKAGGVLPQDLMSMCYNYTPSDYKPQFSPAICDAFKINFSPCSAAPDLSALGYTKKPITNVFQKDMTAVQEYCRSIIGSAQKKMSFNEALKTYSAGINIKSEDVPNYDSLFASGGYLSWDNIRFYKGASSLSNYYISKAVAGNDYLSFSYYKDVLENSVGTGATDATKTNIYSTAALKAATVKYETIKDYEEDVSKIAGMLKTSSVQASAARLAPFLESEMLNAEAANPDKERAALIKESIADGQADKMADIIKKDAKFKKKVFKELTINPANRIVYPTKGYLSTLPDDKDGVVVRARTIKAIDLQAKRDAMLEAGLDEIADMRIALSKLVAENSKISTAAFDSKKAAAEISALLK